MVQFGRIGGTLGNFTGSNPGIGTSTGDGNVVRPGAVFAGAADVEPPVIGGGGGKGAGVSRFILTGGSGPPIGGGLVTGGAVSM